MKESSLQSKILKKLNGTPMCEAVATTVGLYGRKGEPDIMGCYIGRMFVIEVKLPGNDPTPIQRKRMSDWRVAGAYAAVMTSDKMIDNFLEDIR